VSTAKAWAIVGIITFFSVVAYFTLASEPYINLSNDVSVNNVQMDEFTNSSSLNNTGSLDTSILSIWDYLFRFIDIAFVGIVFFSAGELGVILNLILFFPLRILLIILIVQIARGST